MVHALVDGRQVHLDHLFALLAEGLLRGLLHIGDGFVNGDDVRQAEEGRLQHHAGVVAQAQLPGDGVGVDDVEFGVLFGQPPLDGGRQLTLQLLGGPAAVQQEGTAGLQLGDDVVLIQERLVVAGHEVRLLHQIGGEDGLLAEAQMAPGDAEGLLGVVLEVRLGVHIGVVADDLDGVLVGAHGAVAAQAPELAADHLLVGQGQAVAHGQGAVGHIVLNAHGEAGEGLVAQQVVEHGLDLGGSGVLGGETIAAAADVGGVLPVSVGGADSQIQGVAGRAHFLAAVQNGDLLHRLGQGGPEMLLGERIEQMDLEIANLLTQRV